MAPGSSGGGRGGGGGGGGGGRSGGGGGSRGGTSSSGGVIVAGSSGDDNGRPVNTYIYLGVVFGPIAFVLILWAVIWLYSRCFADRRRFAARRRVARQNIFTQPTVSRFLGQSANFHNAPPKYPPAGGTAHNDVQYPQPAQLVASYKHIPGKPPVPLFASSMDSPV